MIIKRILFFVLIASFVSFYSCKKSDADLLIDSWQGNEAYVNSELDEFNDLFKTFVMLINEDGTSTYTSFLVQNLTWTFDDDSKIFHVITEDATSDDLTCIIHKPKFL